MSFVFWTTYPNHHLAGWISELASRCDFPVYLIAEKEIWEARRKMGWSMPDTGRAIFEVGISTDKISRIITDAGPLATHLFYGLNMIVYPGMHEAFLQCVKKRGLRIGLMSERPVWENQRSLLYWKSSRLLWGKLNHLRFGKRLDFILGLGEHAARWFKFLGYDDSRIFDFAYYPPRPRLNEIAAPVVWPGNSVRLLHVGSITTLKGIDLIIQALAQVGTEDWFFGLVGCGDGEQAFKTMAEDLGLSERIAFWGAMPGDEAMAVLSSADVLILASRIDAYGAVVSEALCRGVPVICSAEAGACQAVRRDLRLGSIFSSPSSLGDALRFWIRQGHRTTERATTIKQLSECLLPEAGADYFLKIMAHVYDGAPRPAPPWNHDPAVVDGASRHS